MGAAAANRVNASTLQEGYVIAVELKGGFIVPTRRKSGYLEATVTGKTTVPGARQARYVIHTDQGDTDAIAPIQTFPLIAEPSSDAPAVPAPAEPIDPAQLWREYETAHEFALAGDQDAPSRDDMRPRTETFRGRRLKVARAHSWGTIDMFVNGASAGSTTGSSAAAMNRAAEQLRKDVLAADERRVTDPDAYPAVWYDRAEELPPAIIAYVRYRAEQDERDRAALAATTCTDPNHESGVMGCPLSMLDCNGVPAGSDSVARHEVNETAGMTGFDMAALDFRRTLAGQLPDVGPVSTGETPWDHKRVRRVAVWQLSAAGHLITVVHYDARPSGAERPLVAVLIDGELSVSDIKGDQPSDELCKFLAWLITNRIRKLIKAAPAATKADQGDQVPTGGVDVEAPAGDQGDAPALPTVEGVPAGMPYVATMPEGWPVAPVRIEAKEVARILRTEFLPAWFPGVKFSVRTDRGSMYVGADISWTDGPASQLVALVADMWRGMFYDGQHESTSYRGAVLYVNTGGVATAYDLPGISINTHRDVSRAAIDKATEFLRDVPTDSIRAHSKYLDPFGRPWFGGSVEDCARWLAEYGVDRDTRDVRGHAPVDRDACPVGQCALAKGHRWPALHRNDYGRAFLALPKPGDGDQGDGGTPTTPGPDDTLAPAPTAPTFRTWEELAEHIRPALAGAQSDAPVIRPELGDWVRVSGWSGVCAFVLSQQQDSVGAFDTGETLRFPIAKVTEVTTATLTDMRTVAAEVLASSARAADIVEPARAILATPTWESGKPKSGEGVYALALDDTDGKRLENVELIARVVTELGCGCFRIECYQPGPVKGDRSWVTFRTGCSWHDAQVSVPMPTVEELDAARAAGTDAYEMNVPAVVFPVDDERIAPTFERLPVGSAVYSALITAYHKGYEAAAERAVKATEYAVTVSEQNAADGAAIAERNPAAQECADINAAGAASARATLEARTAELAETREILAGDQGEAISPKDLHQHHRVTYRPTGKTFGILGGDTRYSVTGDGAGEYRADPSGTGVLLRSGVESHPWGWVAPLTDLVALPNGEGRYHRDHLATTAAQLESTFEGSWRQAAADDQGDDESGDWPEFYTLTMAEYAPELPSDEGDDVITVTHDHENGTVLDGSVRGDGVYEIAKRHGFTFRPSVGIFVMGSRDKFANLRQLRQLGEALREAGHKVAFEINDVWRPAAVRAEARGERVTARVERLAARAARKAGEGDARYEVARSISDGMPFGEPIKIGHHSEGKHRRAFERIDANYRAAWGAYDYARSLAGRADGAAANEAAKRDPRAMMCRSETVAADVRKFERELSELMESDAGNRSPYRRRLLLEIERGREEVAFIAAQLGDKATSGEFVAWSKADFVKGDYANIAGRWCEVVRVNAKSVSVADRFGWGGSGTASWDEVFGRRRDGQQIDSPNGEPWPVADAVKVDHWEELTARARRPHLGDDSRLHEAANHGRALRLVLGMAKNSGNAEVNAYGHPADKLGQRRRALAAFDVYERLTAGETFEQIAATIEPLNDSTPRWVMPTGEPTEVHVTDLRVGDIVVGIYDVGFAGCRPRLIASMVGPVTGNPETRDRRESGEWTTVEVDGDSHEVKSYRRVLAHVGAGRR